MLDPDAPSGTFTHWLVYGMPPQHLQPGGCAGRSRRRRQRLRPARLRGSLAAAERGASLSLRGPCACHPAGSSRRSDKVRSGSTHQRSRAGQGRTSRDLPARLIGSRPAPSEPNHLLTRVPRAVEAQLDVNVAIGLAPQAIDNAGDRGAALLHVHASERIQPACLSARSRSSYPR